MNRYEQKRTEHRRKVREDLRKNLGSMCNDCGEPEQFSVQLRKAPDNSRYAKKKVYVSNLQAHHTNQGKCRSQQRLGNIKDTYTELDDLSDVELLCSDCHKKKHQGCSTFFPHQR